MGKGRRANRMMKNMSVGEWNNREGEKERPRKCVQGGSQEEVPVVAMGTSKAEKKRAWSTRPN